jgi:two-component system NarL family sensor kinase
MGVRQPLEGNRGVATPILTRLAWALGVVVVAILAATLLLIMGARGVQLPPGFQAPSALSALQFLGPAIVGAILAALRPRNPIGWLLLGLGLCFVTYQLVVAYLTTALFVTPAGLPAVGWVAWVGNWIWVPGHACIVLLFLLFPTGQLLSPRWRPAAWLGVGATALVLIAAAGYPGPVEVANSIPDANLRQRFENPLGMAGFLPVFLAGLTVVQALQVVGVVSLVLRLRRSRGEERQQIKWVAYAALLLGLETVASRSGTSPG